MSKWHGGKGSSPRPVNKSVFDDNFDRIFSNSTMSFNDTFSAFCGDCETYSTLVVGEDFKEYKCSCGGVLEKDE